MSNEIKYSTFTETGEVRRSVIPPLDWQCLGPNNCRSLNQLTVACAKKGLNVQSTASKKCCTFFNRPSYNDVTFLNVQSTEALAGIIAGDSVGSWCGADTIVLDEAYSYRKKNAHQGIRARD